MGISTFGLATYGGVKRRHRADLHHRPGILADTVKGAFPGPPQRLLPGRPVTRRNRAHKRLGITHLRQFRRTAPEVRSLLCHPNDERQRVRLHAGAGKGVLHVDAVQ